MKHERNVIAVDFDETLTLGGRWWIEGEECIPNFKMIEWINKKYRLGSVIIIHSARPWECARETVAWLIKYNVRYHGLYLNKLGADEYWDDKAHNIKEIIK